MSYDYTTDAQMLAAGNARALPGGDPDVRTVSPTAGAVTGSGPPPPRFTATGVPLMLTAGPRRPAPARVRVRPDDLVGDLGLLAAHLNVDVADLVALRRAHTRTRGGFLRRLFTKD